MTPHQNGWHNNNDWISLGFMLLVLIIAAAAALVLWNDRKAHPVPARQPDQSPAKDTTSDSSDSQALRLLEQRFARGEIDANEFVRSRDLLQTRP